MSGLLKSLADQVIDRANNRCEYCQLSQSGQEATFHIDHVLPRVANGPTTLENLALACVSCSLRKGAKQVAVDSVTSGEVPIFNPRLWNWGEHFHWEGAVLKAVTGIGRATIAALSLNRPMIVAIRMEEVERGRHPPKGFA